MSRYEKLAEALMGAPDPVRAIASLMGDHEARIDALVERLHSVTEKVGEAMTAALEQAFTLGGPPPGSCPDCGHLRGDTRGCWDYGPRCVGRRGYSVPCLCVDDYHFGALGNGRADA